MSRVAIEGNASGSGTFTIAAPNSNNNRTISIPDGTGTMVVNGASSSIVADTAKSATSTAVDFTGIPSWVKRITVMFQGVSTTGTSQPMFQLGDSGGIETTGYTTVAASITTVANSATSYTNGWQIFSSNSARVIEGNIVFSLINASTNTWSGSGQFCTELPSFLYTVGTKSLSATLDRVRITTAGGTDTFDAGTINILYE